MGLSGGLARAEATQVGSEGCLASEGQGGGNTIYAEVCLVQAAPAQFESEVAMPTVR